MNLTILDTDFKMVGVLDEYKSFIWTDRYYACGDFEIVTSVTEHNLQLLQIDRYIMFERSDRMMIIETVQLDTDAEEGVTLTVSGRSLESILDRRIIWGTLEINGSVQNAIKTMIANAIISPSDTARKISNFIFLESTDTAITSLTTESQFKGDTLYDAITSICMDKSIGYKVVLNDDNEFVFSLYAGVDRSYNQEIRPYVVFSPKFENIDDTCYMESKANYKNATYVVGSESSNQSTSVIIGSYTGLDRREVFTDASGTSQESGTSSATYVNELKGKGNETLAEYQCVSTCDGNTQYNGMFEYLVDYGMGDILEIVNEYGIAGTVRMTEFIQSEDASEMKAYPTFINAGDY